MSNTLITGDAIATSRQMQEYIKKVNPAVNQSVIDMIPFYLSEGEAEGIRGDIAFAQSCLETGNFSFVHSAVTLDQNNFAGMGVTQNGMKGLSFETPQMGIRAQIQHLKAYANNEPLNNPCIDPRFKYVSRASAQLVEWLGIQENPMKKGWAAGAGYGAKIMTILNNILQIKDTTTEGNDETMKIFVCVGHAYYKNGAISSADGTKYGGVNEYKYNKALAPYVVDWLKKAGHKADLCIAPEKKFSCLQDEIEYFIGKEHAKDYDLAIQLHLNAFNGSAHGTEAYAYDSEGLKVANAICKKLGTVWKNRGGQIKPELYWTRQTNAKAVLIESFFCDSADDCAKAEDLGYSAHGKLIAEGIIGKSIKVDSGASDKVTEDTVNYTVQTGAFSNKNNAEALKEKLKKAGFDAFVKKV